MAKKKSANKSSAARREGSREGPAKRASDGLLVAGIGASAGGLGALRDFFSASPPRKGISYVIVQHLDPNHESLTAELLARHTSMPVSQVRKPVLLEAGKVFVIPPNKYLSVTDGVLRATEPTERRGSRAPIDFFMRSIASVCHERAIGVVLSGTGSDGTLGLKAIRGEGGLTVVQHPDTAQFDGMPRSAIAAGVVDHVLPVAEIAGLLAGYVEHPKPAALDLVPDDGERPPDLDAILALLRTRTRFDFRAYTPKTLLRRTLRRMSLRRIEDMGDYLRFLREHPAEIEELVHDMLIRVTDFFRDPDAWGALEETVLEPLVASKQPYETIRAWVPACATGEEPYALCMLLVEQLQKQHKICNVQVFATDVDKRALKIARAGDYPSTIVADVTSERLRRFFSEGHGDHGYRVAQSIRESVVFAEQNVLADPPFSKVDLICCRNLLIYLRPEAQDRVRSLFHFALKQGGYLMLGGAETIGKQTDLFQPVSRKWRIFRRIGAARPDRVELPVAVQPREPEVVSPLPERRRSEGLVALAQKSLLQQYAPVAALVDSHFEILYFSGDTDPYLTQPPGPPTKNLLDRLRPGLRAKLRACALRALRNDEAVGVEARVKRGERLYPVRLSVSPIRERAGGDRVLLVVFEDSPGRVKPRARHGVAPTVPDESLVAQLESELAETKEELQHTIEQLEMANEEFQASHEEVMSGNEELQSSNEELETAKEELQSMNEELSTVNAELVNKLQELESKHNDLTNLLSSTDIATICLDRELGIRWFTPATRALMNITPADIGRPITDLSHRFLEDDLPREARSVLETLAPTEREIPVRGDRTYLRRIVPYRTEDDGIAGVVVTLIDISDRKLAARHLETLNSLLEQQLTARIELNRVAQDVTQAASAAVTIEEGLREALIRLCQTDRWVLGQAWVRGHDGREELVLAASWTTASDPRIEAFRDSCRSTPLAHEKGPLARVLQTVQPLFVEDLREGDDPRLQGRDLTLRSMLAFPVSVDWEVEAVIELFAMEAVTRKESLLDIAPAIGLQLGHLMKRKRLEREVANQSDQERLRVGRELHDSVGQQLTALGLMIGNLASQLEGDGSKRLEAVAPMAEAVEEAKRQLRALTRGLAPLEVTPEGLVEALRTMVEQSGQSFRVHCELQCPKPVTVENELVAYHLYRIAQEAVHNALKHANPTRVTVVLEDGGRPKLRVRDDGIGLRTERGAEGSGLRIMRYRANLIGAAFRIEPVPGGGTEVSVLTRRKVD